ncbi:phosphonate ABC transporter, permease protein PhnE [Gluconobacter oxydans]|uniref:phosphonate ABC transporter, permease protein PhnE n=1 Tax=Gluconobacter oxydans TaxID=442 RepID=UPI0039E88073
MTQPSADYDSILQHQNKAWTRAGVIALAIACVIIVSSYHSGLLDLERLGSGFPALWQLGTEMFPPDFNRGLEWISPLIDTLAMSIAGTAIAVLISLPVGFFASGKTAPNAVIYMISRGLLNGLRSIPELIMGIVFVAAVGFGALPGVLALGLHSVGMVGKFFAEAIEHCDNAPIEAARAAGASPFQIVTRAILPQVLPQLADVTIYRWEYNFRASTILGTVGAGGIGFELITSLRIMNYQEVLAIMLVVLLMVTIVDQVGALLRRQLQ